MLTRPGETRSLSAVAYDAAGREVDAKLAWTSSRPGAIGVDGTGKVTAATPNGSTQIVAEASGTKRAVATTVLDAVIALRTAEI